MVKNSPSNAGAAGLIHRSGRSPREGIGSPLHFSFVGNPRNRGAWRATVHGITEESDMIEQLNNNNEQFQKGKFKTSLEGREILSQKTPNPKPSVC